MSHPRSKILVAAIVLTLALGASAGAQSTQQALQLNQPVTGTASDGTPAVFTFTAESAGMLTVVVRGQSDTDLQLTIADIVGQPLPEGSSDQDLGGDYGAEQVAAVIPSAGEYQVRVGSWSGSGSFEMIAGWIAYPALGGPVDPDALPTAAAELAPGAPIDDSIDPSSGDSWDWFKVTVEGAAAITVITTAPEGDLALEAFAEGEYAAPISSSDQDMQGVAGNESITIQAQAGETYYFKVTPFSNFGGAIPYNIRVGVM